ncbi:MAG: ribosome assembly RNA-binding protein YhbY [Ruminococcaceae bacterium]|nr:ribosome assembly RNA-binding protein YhbY [Oscillospiraceae bacterium]
MLNSKQRAALRACANQIDTILQVGKGGIGDTLVKQIDDALVARELIKIKVLENCEYTAREVAEFLSGKTDSEPVQVIGNKVVLFRRNNKAPKYDKCLK